MEDRAVIKNAVVHLHGRLPLLADLRAVPQPRDLSLIATNVRTRDGKRPSFAEDPSGWFLIPLREVVVIELPAHALDDGATLGDRRLSVED
jgi:hypothetical protein